MKNSKETFAPLFESKLYSIHPEQMVVSMLPRVEAKMGTLFTANATQSIEGYKADVPVFVEVLQVGEGFDGEDEKPPFKVGNVILINHLTTVLWYRDFLGAVCGLEGTRTLGMTLNHIDNARLVFEDMAAYTKALSIVEESK